jgi:hypothetical protein
MSPLMQLLNFQHLPVSLTFDPLIFRL